MRPDEHKKKKSAQYNKKHGTSTKQKSKTENKDKGEVSKSKPLNGAKHASKSGPSTNMSDSSEEGEITPGVIYEKKIFQRRSIKSNWDRYEIPNEEENTEESRGSDFAELMNLTGSAVSQFRFKDEKNWESEQSDASVYQYLSIDLDDLSTSLDCIPLYKRLAIDKQLFTESQIEDMEQQANLNKKQYKPKNETTNPTNVKIKQNSHVVPEANSADTVDKLTVNMDSRLSLEECDINVVNGSVQSENELSVDHSTNSVTSVIDQEDELERLLCLVESSSTEQLDTGMKENLSKNHEQTPECSKPLHQQVSGTVPGMEDLEDWLDSVLDG